MHIAHRLALLLTLVLSPIVLRGQAVLDASGHWEGAIQAPGGRNVSIEVDLGKAEKGVVVATYSNPSDGVRGVPLADVVVNGKAVRFHLKANGGGTFEGDLSPDSKTMSGNFNYMGSGFLVPFHLSRTGEARFDPPSRSAAISKELEGTWNGTLDLGTQRLRLVLSLRNQTDGSSVGSIVSLDQDGLEIPVTTITQKGASVVLDIKSAGSSYSATLNAESTELRGMYQQKQTSIPLVFSRTSVAGRGEAQ